MTTPNKITGAKVAGACGFMRLVSFAVVERSERRLPPLRSVLSLDIYVSQLCEHYTLPLAL
jgi:hypothetical protein